MILLASPLLSLPRAPLLMLFPTSAKGGGDGVTQCRVGFHVIAGQPDVPLYEQRRQPPSRTPDPPLLPRSEGTNPDTACTDSDEKVIVSLSTCLTITAPSTPATLPPSPSPRWASPTDLGVCLVPIGECYDLR